MLDQWTRAAYRRGRDASSTLFPVGIRDLRLWGTVAVAVWLTTFALGSLLPSCPIRRKFDPELTVSCDKRVPEASHSALPSGPGDGDVRPTSLSVSADSWQELQDFLLGTATYTPSNLAILALASGFLAGCAGRLMWAARRVEAAEAARRKTSVAERQARSVPLLQPATPLDPPEDAQDLDADDDLSDDAYLRESPFASMFRSFVAYLLAVAGVLVISPDMFNKTTPETYMRMAGLVSALAFAVGYDPRRLTGLLSQVAPTDATNRGTASAKR